MLAARARTVTCRLPSAKQPISTELSAVQLHSWPPGRVDAQQQHLAPPRPAHAHNVTTSGATAPGSTYTQAHQAPSHLDAHTNTHTQELTMAAAQGRDGGGHRPGAVPVRAAAAGGQPAGAGVGRGQGLHAPPAVQGAPGPPPAAHAAAGPFPVVCRSSRARRSPSCCMRSSCRVGGGDGGGGCCVCRRELGNCERSAHCSCPARAQAVSELGGPGGWQSLPGWVGVHGAEAGGAAEQGAGGPHAQAQLPPAARRGAAPCRARVAACLPAPACWCTARHLLQGGLSAACSREQLQCRADLTPADRVGLGSVHSARPRTGPPSASTLQAGTRTEASTVGRRFADRRAGRWESSARPRLTSSCLTQRGSRAPVYKQVSEPDLDIGRLGPRHNLRLGELQPSGVQHSRTQQASQPAAARAGLRPGCRWGRRTRG